MTETQRDRETGCETEREIQKMKTGTEMGYSSIDREEICEGKK